MNTEIPRFFKVAVYIRLSKEDGDKEESDSVGNQKKLLTEYVSKQDDLILYDIYIDDGYTGTNFNRPAFQRMLVDIREGRVNCVAVKDLSRFGRDYIDTGRYLERIFPEMGVRFLSLTDGIDSIKQAYDLLLPIKNIFNEQYARDISRKVRTAVKTKQMAGEFIGAFASYGYKKSAENRNKLIIDEYAAAIVRRIFSLYIQGYGKQKIAGMLNAEGIPCPTEYKQINGENYKNSNRLKTTTYWSYSTINEILHKEIYAGNMVQGTKQQYMRGRQKKISRENWIIVENTHEPIVDKETWEKVQSLLNKRTRTLNLEEHQNMFAGFLKCGDCGRAMAKNVWRCADGSKSYRLYCGTYRRNGKEYCTPHALPVSVLEKIVLGDLRMLIRSLGDLRALVESQCFAVQGDKENLGSELSRVEAELERVRKRKKGLYEDYKDALISKEEFLSYRRDYTKKEAFYSDRRNMLREKKTENMIEDNFETPWLRRLLDCREVETLDRDIVVEMISEIRVYENRRIKIIYNFKGNPEHFFSDVPNSI